MDHEPQMIELTEACLMAGVDYTEAMNLLNYSVVVIPVTRADKDVDLVDESYQPLNATDKKNWDACRSRYTMSVRSRLLMADLHALYR